MKRSRLTLLIVFMTGFAWSPFVSSSPLTQTKSTSITVKMNTVTNNCGGKAPDINVSQLTLAEENGRVQLSMEGLPVLAGNKSSKGNLRLTAKTQTSRYSANGRHKSGSLRLVLIIEHFNGDKPTCTQSFSITSN